jgi:hypothetical protein
MLPSLAVHHARKHTILCTSQPLFGELIPIFGVRTSECDHGANIFPFLVQRAYFSLSQTKFWMSFTCFGVPFTRLWYLHYIMVSDLF